MTDEREHDYTVRITTDDTPARYRLTFGSLLRGGVVYASPSLDRDHGGRAAGGVVTIEPGNEHRWRADGPISLLNNGRGTLTVEINDGAPIPVDMTGTIDTSCPTERKRITALGVLGGALVGGATGVLDL